MAEEGRRTNHIVGVRFIPAGRVHYFDPGDIELADGDQVLVEADGGTREGIVVIAPGQMLFSELRGPLPPLLSKVEG